MQGPTGSSSDVEKAGCFKEGGSSTRRTQGWLRDSNVDHTGRTQMCVYLT